MKKKFGAFPLFWQDIKDWEPWAEVRKAYMIDTEDTSREAVDDAPAEDKTEDIAAIAKAAEVAPAIKALMGDLAPAATEGEPDAGDVRMIDKDVFWLAILNFGCSVFVWGAVRRNEFLSKSKQKIKPKENIEGLQMS